MSVEGKRPIGLIAGGGAVPVEIANSVTARGGSVYVICIKGDADAALHAHPHTIAGWSELGKAIAALKAANVADVLLVGTMARPKFWTARFDLAFFSIVPAVLKVLRQGGDDALLRTCIELFERRGFRAVGIRDVAPDLLISPGAVGSVKPQAKDETEIALGLRLIAALGRFDIGQAAIVSDGAIEAIEGAEGTDAMLARTAAARASSASQGERRGVLVKRPKPSQDMRVDLPAIGPGTATSAAAAGLSGVAAMAGYVLIATRGEMIARANAAGVFVAGVEAPMGAAAETSDRTAGPALCELGAVTLDGATARDAALGVRVLRALGDFQTGSALVVRKNRVMAIGASEPALDVVLRDAAYNTRGKNSRRGAAVIAAGQTIDEALISAAAQAGVAAIVIAPEQEGAMRNREALAAMANSLRLALAVCEFGTREGKR